MKALGYFVILGSLIAGSMFAASAYHAPLHLADEHFKGDDGQNLTIKTDSGVVLVGSVDELHKIQERHTKLLLHFNKLPPSQAGESSGHMLLLGLLHFHAKQKSGLVDRALSIDRVDSFKLLAAKIDWLDNKKSEGLVLIGRSDTVPLARKYDRLTEELLKKLRRQSKIEDKRVAQHYVIVREFSFSRWSGKWYFAIAVIGLLAGALVVRYSAKKSLAEAPAAGPSEGPRVALEQLRLVLADLQSDIAALDEPAALDAIIERLSAAQRTHMHAFIEAKPQLIARMGLGRYAELMDSYAACERQINRAWSAAADGVHAESVECLAVAAELLEETLNRLPELGN